MDAYTVFVASVAFGIGRSVCILLGRENLHGPESDSRKSHFGIFV